MSQLGYATITLLLIVLMALVALLMPTRLGLRWWIWAWIINLVLMFLVMGTIGLSIKAESGWWAIFVDNRNMVSLSRFQIVLWTLVVLSAFWTIALARTGDSTGNPRAYVCESPALEGKKASCAAPADLQLPATLWALMGISVTSAVASSLIKENKAQRTAADGGQNRYAASLQQTLRGMPLAGEFENRGAVVTRKSGKKPKFSDMFKGEDPKGLIYIDIAKVQNFFFTVVAVAVYAVALGAALVGAKSIASLFQFPDISEGLLGILGISHAGYLVNKATVTSAPPPPDQ